MGTRHIQKVINKKGEVKLNQYGQWDGYPEGQGVDILMYLKHCNIKNYEKEINKLNPINEEQDKMVEQDQNWKENYPYLSRDCGSKIHLMIESGKVQFVSIADEDVESWCEGFYTIDFEKNKFTTEFYGYKKSYPLNRLPSKKKYLSDYKKYCDAND